MKWALPVVLAIAAAAESQGERQLIVTGCGGAYGPCGAELAQYLD